VKHNAYNIFDTDTASAGLVGLAIAADDAQGSAVAAAGQFTKTLENAIGAAHCAGGVPVVQELLSAVLAGYLDELSARHTVKAELTACLKNRLGKPLSRMSGTDRMSGLWAGLSIKDRSITVAETREGAGIKAPRGASQAPVTASSSAPTVADILSAVGSLDQGQLIELVQEIGRSHLSDSSSREIGNWLLARVKVPSGKRAKRIHSLPPIAESPSPAPVPVSVETGAPLTATGQ
jgi:hypothetical protein